MSRINQRIKTAEQAIQLLLIYGAIAIFLIGLQFFQFGSSPSKNMTEDWFRPYRGRRCEEGGHCQRQERGGVPQRRKASRKTNSKHDRIPGERSAVHSSTSA